MKSARRTVLGAVMVLMALASAPLYAQRAAGRATHATSAQQAAPIDLTGYWVSVISQDWLYRMVVMQRGQYSGVPINGRARAFADAWNRDADIAAGKQCEAYGAAILMRLPEHLHITWQDANSLQVQADAGMQTRLLRFEPTMAQMHASASLQGLSVARWVPYLDAPGGNGAVQRRGGQAQYGYLQVETTDMLPGLLRKNGVPYSDQTHMLEQWALNAEPDGAQWLTISTELTDPVYLQGRYVITSVFQKLPDGARWDPQPCYLQWY